MKSSLNLTVEKVAFGGEGIGFIDGKACFVEDALPGETVQVRVLSEKKNFIKARLVKVLKASTDRVEPPCRYYGVCGGCQYQHVSYPAELAFKEEQVRGILGRQAGVDPSRVSAIRSAGREYGYRNGVTLQVQFTAKKRFSKAEPVAGFIGRDNQALVPVKSCLIADPRLAEVFHLKTRLEKNTERLSFKLTDQGEVVSDLEERFFRVRLKNETLLTSSRSFFQNNLAVTELVIDEAARRVEKAKPDEFFDLYAGGGTFSFLAAKRVPEIVCVEESPASLAALKMNRDEKRPTSMEIIAGRVERVFPKRFERSAATKSMIFMDPPRQGLDPALSRFLATCGAFSILYLSCDPATLARDLKVILEGGRYRVVEAIPFDMFPRTAHVEVLVVLTPSSANK